MPNRWTRVPDGAPPALPLWGALVLPLADLFMLAMLSRPASGSLRVTWVTPATLVLSLAAAVGMIAVFVVCAIALAAGGGWAPIAGMAVIAVIASGSSAVVLVGAAQRRRR